MIVTARKILPLALVLAGISCAASGDGGRLVVLAPVELQVLLDPLMQQYTAEFGPSDATATYTRSSELNARAGNLHAAIVMSTHPSWAQLLSDRLSVIERAVVGRDRLVIAASGTPAPLAAGGDARALLGRGDLGVIALPNSEMDSVGMYAREALLRYGIWSRVESNVMTTADSVEAAAAVNAGSAGVGILLESTAVASGLNVLASFDPALHQAVRFEALLIDDRHTESRRLWQFLTAQAGSTLERR